MSLKEKIIRNRFRKINHKFTMLRPATVLPNSAESTYIYVYIYIYIYTNIYIYIDIDIYIYMDMLMYIKDFQHVICGGIIKK